jgi:hypothetical protein
MPDGDQTPEIAREWDVEAVWGAATAWRRSVALLHDAPGADLASDDTRRWNTAVDRTARASAMPAVQTDCHSPPAGGDDARIVISVKELVVSVG